MRARKTAAGERRRVARAQKSREKATRYLAYIRSTDVDYMLSHAPAAGDAVKAAERRCMTVARRAYRRAYRLGITLMPNDLHWMSFDRRTNTLAWGDTPDDAIANCVSLVRHGPSVSINWTELP